MNNFDNFDNKEECNICSITIRDLIINDTSNYIEKCSKCVFKSCNNCMKKWYKENNHCPQCREPGTFDISNTDIKINPNMLFIIENLIAREDFYRRENLAREDFYRRENLVLAREELNRRANLAINELNRRANLAIKELNKRANLAFEDLYFEREF